MFQMILNLKLKQESSNRIDVMVSPYFVLRLGIDLKRHCHAKCPAQHAWCSIPDSDTKVPRSPGSPIPSLRSIYQGRHNVLTLPNNASVSRRDNCGLRLVGEPHCLLQ